MIENVVPDGELVVVQARTAAERAACPACGTLSARVRSRLADSAVGGRPVLIECPTPPWSRGRRRTEARRVASEGLCGLTPQA
ncbi:hypothetical protein [Streptomyces mirabilis]|uniref:hypothetical protein n=1 Tax=Streptomyces mirabilis TaxID=68239 RepID=UPI0036816EF1